MCKVRVIIPPDVPLGKDGKPDLSNAYNPVTVSKKDAEIVQKVKGAHVC